jgi:HlyD family secretion protein
MELYVIRAPTDGTIVRRYANPGSGASTFSVTAMFQLQPNSLRIVRAEVEERSITLVKVGQKVEIVPESDQAKSLSGRSHPHRRRHGRAQASLRRSPANAPTSAWSKLWSTPKQAPVLVGQRVLVKFLKDGANATQAAEKTAQRWPH